MSSVDGLLRIATRRAGRVLALCLALTAAAAWRIVDFETGELRIFLDPSVNRMFAEDDPERAFYDRVRRLFGSDETILVVLADEDVFSADNLRRLKDMTERIAGVPGVHHVVSLANAPVIRGAEGELLIEPLIGERVPEDPRALARIREQALGDPIYGGSLVALDGGATALMVYLRDMSEREFLASGIDEAIVAIAHEERGDAEVWISGVAHVKAEIGRMLVRDLARVVPAALAVMMAVAWLSFGTLQGVAVPLVTIAMALVWTFGIVGLFADSLHMVSVAAPPILLVVGFAYTVHVVSEYYDRLRAGPDAARAENALAALRHVWLAVVLTGITTAAGFLSLVTSPLLPVREFGLVSALGVAMAMLASLSVAPALLCLLPAPRRVRARVQDGRLERLLGWLARFDLQRRRPILLAGGVLALLSLAGMTRIEVSTNFIDNLPADSSVRRDVEAVNARLEGSNALYVVLEAPEAGGFKEPALLEEVDRLQQWLEALPEVGGTTSLVDYLRVINRGFHENDPAHFGIPESRRLTSQLLFFGGGDAVEGVVDSRYQTAAVVVRFDAIDSGDVTSVVSRIEERLASLGEGITGAVTGNSVLVSRSVNDLAWGQALSLSTAFVIIFAILALLFTSLRTGLVALIPNALPVLVYFGILGFSGITLNTTTGLVACLVLGIAVDDTIHFLTHFNAAARRFADEARGVKEALRTVGRPVTYTSAALCAGFLVLTLSEMRDKVEFGVLAAGTLAVAWLIDVSFTPALAARLRIVTLWDVVTLDLGEDPHRSIPFFEGLRKTEARITALMMRIVELPRGHRLMRAGEVGNEMYVVIDGALRASLETERGRVVFNTLERGDTVGEVGVFHGRRTADVDVERDARLLRIDQSGLERLKRRYPRLAAQLYRNLSEILADRVATTTDRVR